MKAWTFFLCLFAAVLIGHAQEKAVSEQEARKLAADFLNTQLKGKQFEDFKGGKHPYPQFESKTWRTAELINGRWVLKYDPPAGVYAKVSLAQNGGDLKLESYGNAQL